MTTSRRSWSEPGLRPQLMTLMDTVFPGVAQVIERARALGAAWEDVTTPFVTSAGGEPVSQVSVMGFAMVLDGTPTEVGCLHAVCTHPAHRRQGHYASAMRAALAFCDGRYPAQLLCTAQPEIYEPFGFRVVDEHKVIAEAAPRLDRRALRPFRLADAEDHAVFQRLARRRAPVSARLGITGPAEVFVINELDRPLFYAEDLDAIVSMEIVGDVLCLHDIVAAELPPLDEILRRLPAPVRRVELYACPDTVGMAGTAEPHVFVDGDDAVGGAGAVRLMVRGRFPEGPLMLPRPFRC
ncbi:GNAT family N-acetyltransferase [Sorangium sp. So ce854]|uniref:GNAT family N-acetyltransferase n=1 Tax=Sorangium sp. So ce854 TaxID=3133322 RepID=UPI003F615B85